MFCCGAVSGVDEGLAVKDTGLLLIAALQRVQCPNQCVVSDSTWRAGRCLCICLSAPGGRAAMGSCPLQKAPGQGACTSNARCVGLLTAIQERALNMQNIGSGLARGAVPQHGTHRQRVSSPPQNAELTADTTHCE